MTRPHAGGGAAGYAWFDSPYSVTAWNYIVSGYSFQHELMHNLGADHDRDNHAKRSPHPYGHGVQVPGELRTVMAYPCSFPYCPVIPFLSADGYTYRNISIGGPTTDNARLVRDNAPAVAAFGDPLPPLQCNLITFILQVLLGWLIPGLNVCHFQQEL